jgi:hypothetical protein
LSSYWFQAPFKHRCFETYKMSLLRHCAAIRLLHSTFAAAANPHMHPTLCCSLLAHVHRARPPVPLASCSRNPTSRAPTRAARSRTVGHAARASASACGAIARLRSVPGRTKGTMSAARGGGARARGCNQPNWPRPPLSYIANVCFKCFRCMLQVFCMDIAKVD